MTYNKKYRCKTTVAERSGVQPLVYLLGVVSTLLIMSVSVFPASYTMLTDLGSSADMISKGNIEGFGSGANSIFDNPAGLYRTNRLSSSVFATQIMKEVDYKNVAIAINTTFGNIGLGYMDAGVDDIPLTAMDGNLPKQIGSFDYKNRIAKLGYQASISDAFHVGASVGAYMNTIHTYQGAGYSMDVGGIYSFSKLEVSLFARNILPSKVVYTNSQDASYKGEETLPLQVVFGSAFHLSDFHLMGQAKFDGVNTLVSAAIDYTPWFLLELITLSAGYKEFSILDNRGNTTTLGAGLNLFGLSFDYAYEKSDHFEFDSNSYFSIGIDF